MDLDVVVTDGNGNFLPNLKKENFRVLEDGKPQQIANFRRRRSADHDGTVDRVQQAWRGVIAHDSNMWAAKFLNQLKPEDWIALEDFDLKTRVDVDFTHNPREVMDYLRQMVLPGLHESCLYDAILETIDRLRK